MTRPTNESNFKNYIKLQMLIKQTCIVLRDLFCHRWELKYKRKWKDSTNRGDELIKSVGSDIYRKAGKQQRNDLEKGDISNFDLTTLCQLLKAFDINSLEKRRIKDIVDVRNKLAHHPTHEVDRNEFELLWKKLFEALLFFGFPQSKLEEFYATDTIDGLKLSNPTVISSENIKQANKLKEEANDAFKNQNYAKSITLYSDAIELPDLSEDVLAILYSNRSSAYIKSGKAQDDNIEKAKYDAKHAINFRPSWWKAYYRLGCVYEANRKYEKAIVAYNKSLSLDPSQSQVRLDRDYCRDKVAVMERKEHLDPQNMPISRDEALQKISKQSGIRDISSDNLNEYMKLLRKRGHPTLVAEADVYLAHNYLIGLDDVPKSYEDAASLFAKAAASGNADAIYNLAILTKNGQGVKRNIPDAIRLLRQAAALPSKIKGPYPYTKNNGVAEAQHALGVCYVDGVGVDLNPIEAVRWFEKGFENGCSASANNLGCMYETGMGVTANIGRAVQYWQIAASSGNVLAMESLERHFLKVGEFKQAREWWQCAMKNGSVTAAQRTEMHKKRKNMLENMAERKVEWQEIKDFFEYMQSINYSNKPYPSKSGFTTFPDFSELSEKAKKGSITAENLLIAYNHFITGMNLFSNKNDHKIEKIIHEFAESYRIEHIFRIWDSDVKEELQHIIELHLKTSVTEEPTNFELDLRICYVSLRFVAMDEMLEFSDVSIKRFPNESYFYNTQQCILGYLQKHGEALRKSNMSLKKFPNSVSLLYNKAVHTRLSDCEPKQTIDAYNHFLSIAPNDHRKIPECYYAIACCYFKLYNMNSCRECYDLGLKAEEDQLSCFLPYDSRHKDLLSNVFRIKSSIEKRCFSGKYEDKLTLNATKSIVDQTLDTNILKINSKPNMTQLTSPNRVESVILHRNWIQMDSNISTTSKGNSTRFSPANLSGLKPITFKDMDMTKDHIYEGFILQASNVEDAGVGPSLALLLIDENHDFLRCFVYNYHQICSCNEIQKKLGFGCSYSILNPYMRIGKDMKPGIRIDDPHSIIIHSITDQSKKCRFCLSVDDNVKKCSRCKRVWYCSKECQNNDWKLLKHKIICRPI